MGIETLFGLGVASFIAVWALWLVAISRGVVPGMVGLFAVLIGLFIGLFALNDERREEQQERYGAALREFFAIVSEDQAAVFDKTRSYSDELPELGEEVIEHPGSIFEQEQSLEPTLTADRNGFTVEGDLGDQSFSLRATRTPGGELEEERTCRGAAAAGCEDGSW
jgi:hypothetical protein